jgi:hypothetical protein
MTEKCFYVFRGLGYFKVSGYLDRHEPGYYSDYQNNIPITRDAGRG